MINVQNILEKPAFYESQKEALLMIELSGVKTAITQPQARLNLSLVIDVSGSMDDPVKKVQVTPFAWDQLARPKPFVPPLPPLAPHWPVQPMPPVSPLWPRGPHIPNEPWLEAANNWNNGEPYLGDPYQDAKEQWEREQERKRQMLKEWEEEQKKQALNQLQALAQNPKKKLQQAKEAAKKAVAQMKDGDYISIVTFADSAKLICASVELNASTRSQVLKNIDSIHTEGSTNLHAGWVMGATEVAKKMNSKFINRVLLLTDGQVNKGIQSSEVIAKDVAGLYEKSISTTTFGIGEGFNEDLLQKMSDSGGGNFYYIDDDNKLEKMFADEFQGLTNLCASEVKLELQLSEGLEVLENLNQYEKSSQNYLIPNVVQHNKIYGLFKIKVNVGNVTQYNLGKTIVSFKDENGNIQKITSDISARVVSEKEWNDMPNHEELKVQETLLVIANNKIKATQALDKGQFDLAKSMLTESVCYAQNAGFQDMRLTAEVNMMTNTLMSADSVSRQALRKDISYQSYKTRTQK